MGNTKKTIKYYCKHNSLQQIYIWFCLPYCPEVCWHGKALRPEEWAIKHAAPCWYRNCRTQWCNCLPQWNHRLVLTPKIPYWSSWLQSQQFPCSQHTIRGTAQRTQFQISFICWDMWLEFFFLLFFFMPVATTAPDSWFSLHKISLLVNKFSPAQFLIRKKQIKKQHTHKNPTHKQQIPQNNSKTN